MLARLIAREQSIPGSAVLDLCTGSGALAVAAARAGAAGVTAVDVSRRAVIAARLNAAINGVRVRALRGDLFEPVHGHRFDAIVSNPPYLPAGEDGLPERGPKRAWAAGRDGRILLDRILDGAGAHLRPGGSLFIVQSSVCGLDATCERMRAAGLAPLVAERRRGPLGPLLAARAPELEAHGLLAAGERTEELAIVLGRSPTARAPGRRPARA